MLARLVSVKILHLASANRWTGAAAPAFAEVEALRAAGVEAHYGYVGGYWGYPYGGYAYGYPGYAVATYGGVKIENAPPESAVYADGYYVGTVDDFNGSFQKLNLEPGAHHIEVMRPGGAPPASVDVNIRAGQTVTFRAN